MAINKVIYGGTTLIDLTGDSITEADVLKGVGFHLPSGESGTGTCEYDSDTSDDTAVIAEVLATKTFHARGAALTGTMPNRGAVSAVISDVDTVYTVPQGFHDGSGTVGISATEIAKLKNHGNIKAGVVILGEEGTYTGEGVSAQTKVATPSTSTQVITPDSGYDYLSQVTVNPISYVETDNAAGGKTATIAG